MDAPTGARDPARRAGLVAIGRNEGERLRRCLASARGRVAALVYVDSGSTDDSLAIARQLGVEVVELDTSAPFTAARARNAGWRRLLEVAPDAEYVQFVDGDCEIAPGWLETALAALEQQPDAAVVCGRRRERFPERSAYNALCDVEWDTPVGEARACGGDAAMRLAMLRRVGGFDPSLIAGEEPELCFRIRRAGGRVLRLDAEMTLHDAAMTRLSQWWRRNVRAGHAYAENAWMHAPAPDRLGAREVPGNWLWGLALPAAALLAAGPTRGASVLLLLAAHAALAARVARRLRARGYGARLARLYGLSCAAGKLPQMLGQARFHLARLLGRRRTLIEYK